MRTLIQGPYSVFYKGSWLYVEMFGFISMESGSYES